jgi:hypothetical protein
MNVPAVQFDRESVRCGTRRSRLVPPRTLPLRGQRSKEFLNLSRERVGGAILAALREGSPVRRRLRLGPAREMFFQLVDMQDRNGEIGAQG